jgi:hypothetical protein
MNTYKTELFDVAFDEPTGQDRPSVTITHRKSEDYLEFFSLASVCIEVEDLLQEYRLDEQEAIKVIRKAAAFFILNGK